MIRLCTLCPSLGGLEAPGDGTLPGFGGHRAWGDTLIGAIRCLRKEMEGYDESRLGKGLPRPANARQTNRSAAGPPDGKPPGRPSLLIV